MIRRAVSLYAALSIFGMSSLYAEEKKHLSYPEFGITTSSMLIHPSIGYWWDRIGLRVSGMYLNEDQHEFHLNIGYEFFASENLQQSINLLTSRVAGSDSGADYKYWATGIAYGVNYKGFFLELGLARPWEDELGNIADDPVIPCGYVGYLYRFRTE